MNLVAYLRDNLAGAWRLMIGQPDGFDRLDTSLEGFWRSFGAILLVAPLALLSLVSQQPIEVEPGTATPVTGGEIALSGVALAVDWFAFPAIFALLAPAFGLGQRYVPFIVARNWASVIISAMVGALHLLHLFGAVPTAIMPYVLLASIGVALRFSYVLARTALSVTLTVALPIVVLDLLVSLTIWSAFDRLM